MKSNLLLHKSTRSSVERFLDKPTPFLIIAGSAGAGKRSLALEIGGQLLGQEVASEHSQVLHLSVSPNKSEISIDQIRELISKLKLTTTGTGEIRRLVFIEDGHYLSEEAQNSLLKTLEEPPLDTQIIMTVDSAHSVLPTITSRGHIVEVRPIELSEAQNFFESENSETEKAWLLADGQAGLMSALLNHSGEHELKTAIDNAKRFITSTKFERLTLANSFTKNRQQLDLLIEGLQKVLKSVHHHSLVQDRKINNNKMTAARKQLEELKAALAANVSPKTVYLKLCLNLGI